MKIFNLPFLGNNNKIAGNNSKSAMEKSYQRNDADTVSIGSQNSIQQDTSTTAKTKEKPVNPSVWQRLMGKGAPREKEWTVLLYVNSTDDLSRLEYEHVSPFRDAGSQKNVDFIAQVAREREGGKAQRLYMENPGRLSYFPKVSVKEDLPVTNMGAKESFQDFLRWGMEKYPAKKYMVIMAGHGGAYRGVIPDNIHKDKLSPADVAEALKDTRDARGGKKLDVIMMDACLMGNAEVAYELKDEARFMVASPEVKYDGGVDYRKIAQNMVEKTKNGNLETEDLVKNIMENMGYGQLNTMSAVNLSKMGRVGESFKHFHDALQKTPVSREVILGVAEKTQGFYRDEAMPDDYTPSASGPAYRQLRDLTHFAENILNDDRITDEGLKSSAKEIVASMREAVAENYVAEGNLYANSHGLSISLATESGDVKTEDYEKLAFTRDTGWKGHI